MADEIYEAPTDRAVVAIIEKIEEYHGLTVTEYDDYRQAFGHILTGLLETWRDADLRAHWNTWSLAAAGAQTGEGATTFTGSDGDQSSRPAQDPETS